MFFYERHERAGRVTRFFAGVVFGFFVVHSPVLADDRCPATGGELSLITVDGRLACLHQFQTPGSDSFNVPVGNLSVDVVLVAGGGAGGQADGGGGGGGAGGLIFNGGVSVTGSVPVFVGDGGSGAGTGGQNGQDSLFGGWRAFGGGGGAPGDQEAGRDGGSGGGGSGGPAGSITTAGSALQVPDFGRDGGSGRAQSPERRAARRAGGGGGGASSQGIAGDATNQAGIGGPGGNGLCSDGSTLPAWLAQTVVADGCFAGGGGGSVHESSDDVNRDGAGGTGGGGRAERPIDGGVETLASSGAPNTGGGGGGARNGAPGAGGTGFVAVRYWAASQVVIADGNSQTGQVNEPVAIPPSILVLDSDGQPIGGIPVTFEVSTGGGTITPTTAILTNALGRATLTSWVLGTSAGEQSLTATSPDLANSPQTFVAVATAGEPTTLSLATGPSALVINGEPFPIQPRVRLRDQWGNSVSRSGIEVEVVLNSGSPLLSGGLSALTDASGVAEFEDLVITGSTGPRVLRFDSDGLSSAVSNVVSVRAGPAVGLAFIRQPSSVAQSGELFSEQPRLQLVDVSGNAVSQSGVVASASLVFGDGVLSGELTATTDADGRATFVDLSIAGFVGDYRLEMSAPDLSSVESDVVALIAGPPSTLVLEQAPSLVIQNGEVFPVGPIVGLRDEFNNPALVSGVLVRVELSSGGGELSGTLTATTDAQGRASFADLVITGIVGPRTLRFVAEGYGSVTSAEFDLACGRCQILSVVVQPGDIDSGSPFSVFPVVEQIDSAGNLSLAPRSITVALASGSGQLSGTTTVISSGGRAVFDDLSITGVTGLYSLIFSSEGVVSATSDEFELFETLLPIIPVVIPAGAGAVICQPSLIPKGGETQCLAKTVEGFTFFRWVDCSGEVVSDSCRLSNITRPITLIAEFRPVPKPLPVSGLSPYALVILSLLLMALALGPVSRPRRIGKL